VEIGRALNELRMSLLGELGAYYRVSTARQGRSGLGLKAQRTAVRQFLDGGKWKLVGEFTEIESGKKDAGKDMSEEGLVRLQERFSDYDA
jgi:DNA invertase Pin-like site-specific DNA recombinase